MDKPNFLKIKNLTDFYFSSSKFKNFNFSAMPRKKGNKKLAGYLVKKFIALVPVIIINKNRDSTRAPNKVYFLICINLIDEIILYGFEEIGGKTWTRKKNTEEDEVDKEDS